MPAWLERARRLILQPAQEWAAIAGEFAKPAAIYRGFLLPVAAIAPLAETFGTIVFGVRRTIAGPLTVTMMDAVAYGILTYALSFAGVYALAGLIDALAPTFGGQRNRVQALKVAAYAATPYWVFGVCAIIPPLTLVGRVLALYSVYLLWRGLALVMRSPKDKVAAYTLVIAMAGVIITLFVRAIPYIFI
ncbi:MAG: hypothetical protein AUH78_17460 [Gemmatimonadetes bacterium 13_1_40CM_4_69_8]|nr:MAG: hypothetical protein AUH45_10425 [Gemmatimonadetes bacterium 13_1_40CM_69_22]OLC71806.1 MAG: hypothetical protein AUH78_17460 [Gemmatimonadetes bacterium 13_1_40CM_4_69_8]